MGHSHTVLDNSSGKLPKIKEEFQRLISIIMFRAEKNSDNNLQDIIDNSKNEEDIKIANELLESSNKLDKNAEEFQKNLGLHSKPKRTKKQSNVEENLDKDILEGKKIKKTAVIKNKNQNKDIEIGR